MTYGILHAVNDLSILLRYAIEVTELKVYLVFDMEGVTGVSMLAQTGPNAVAPSAYPRAQRMATDEVKAAIDGVLQVDKDAEILFNDAHGHCTNVFFEEFPENVSVVTNSREFCDEVLGLDDSFGALVGVGVHGHHLIADAVLCHMWNVREVKFNGKTLTETCLDAALAGYYGIPLVTISGDEASTRFIQANVSPKIASAAVKKGVGQYNAISLHPKRAQKMIKEAVIDGLKRRKEIPPFTFTNPITVEITYPLQFNAYAINHFMGDERVSATQIKFVAKDAKEAYYGFCTRRKMSEARHF